MPLYSFFPLYISLSPPLFVHLSVHRSLGRFVRARPRSRNPERAAAVQDVSLWLATPDYRHHFRSARRTYRASPHQHWGLPLPQTCSSAASAPGRQPHHRIHR
jgi:hypothetical protein